MDWIERLSLEITLAYFTIGFAVGLVVGKILYGR